MFRKSTKKKNCEDEAKVTEDDTTCVSTGINGKAIVKVADAGGTFDVIFTNVSKDSCVAFVNSEWGSSAGFRGLRINTDGSDTAYATEAGADPAANEVASDSDQTHIFTVITTTCSMCTNSNCTAVWTFL